MFCLYFQNSRRVGGGRVVYYHGREIQANVNDMAYSWPAEGLSGYNDKAVFGMLVKIYSV